MFVRMHAYGLEPSAPQPSTDPMVSPRRCLAASRPPDRSTLQEKAKPVPAAGVFSYGFFYQRVVWSTKHGMALPPLRRKVTEKAPP